MRILIVEDEPSIQRLYAAFLERDGHSTTAVASPAEAIAALDTFRPNLVLLDWLLRDGNGDEVVLGLRQKCLTIPTIVCSGLSEWSVVESFPTLREPPVSCVMMKPNSIEELREAIVAATDPN